MSLRRVRPGSNLLATVGHGGIAKAVRPRSILERFVMITFLSRLLHQGRPSAPLWIEVDELRRRLASGDRIVLLDVRQTEEFASPPGHLPGAINVPLGELSGRIPDLAQRQQPIVVVCKTD